MMQAWCAVGIGWFVILAAFFGRHWYVTRQRHVDEMGTVHYGSGMLKRMVD